MALLLDKATLARPKRHRRVLQRALPTTVANRAVEWVVDEEKLENALLRLNDRRALRVDDHSVGHGQCARGRQAPHTIHLDEAHAAHADRFHPRVPAKARDVNAVALSGGNH